MSIKATPQQQEAIVSRDGPLLVSAAAGSGKTRVLVERLLDAILHHGRHIDDFLVVTYTRAAAGELRGRMQASLSALRATYPQQVNRELLRLHRASIGTIHSFCADVLRRHAVEAGIRPDFKLLEQGAGQKLREQALSLSLEQLYAQEASDSPFAMLSEALSDIGNDRKLEAVVLRLYDVLQAHPNPHGWLQHQVTVLTQSQTLDPADNPWGSYALAQAGGLLSLAETVIATARQDMDGAIETAYAPAFDSDLANIHVLQTALSSGWAHASSAVSSITHQRLGTARGMGDAVEPFKEARELWKKKLYPEIARLLSGSVAEQQADLQSVTPLAHGLQLAVQTFEAHYTALKRRRNVLDFSDLEHLTHAVLCDSEGRATRTAHDVADRFFEVLVDEYQDVNQVQEDIIQALATAGSHLFLVGDVRQSVYGFRQADPQIFMQKYQTWTQKPALPEEPRCVVLPHNFRSDPAILRAVNAVFARIMSREGGGMSYGEREFLWPAPDTPTDIDSPPRATLYLCDRSEDDTNDDSRVALEAEMAASIAADYLAMCSPHQEQYEPHDIAILLRTKRDIPLFRRALALRGIPSTGQEDNPLRNIEVQTVLSYCQLLVNPRQDMALLAVLRSPLYNATTNQLAAMRALAQGDVYEVLLAGVSADDPLCVRLWADITFLRTLSADATVTQLYHVMLERLHLLSIFTAFPDGENKRRMLLSLVTLTSETPTILAFCERLERMQEEQGTATAGHGVTLMTMHKSKGLEFPIVIVADTARKFNTADGRETVLCHKELGLGFKCTDVAKRVQYPTLARDAVARRIERDTLAEEMRLLYVALTRAKEHLIVTATVPNSQAKLQQLRLGLGDKPHPQQVMRADSMSTWLLLALLTHADGNELRRRVQLPMLPETEPASWQLRTWQPTSITQETVSLEDDINEPTPPPPPPSHSPRALETTLPSKLTATEIKGRLRDLELQEDAKPYALGWHAQAFAKPQFMTTVKTMTAAERGTALHLALQFVDYAACVTTEGATAQLASLVAAQKLTAVQGSAVSVADICAFVNAPLGIRVRKSSRVLREFPFSLLTPMRNLFADINSSDTVLLQGVIDLLFWEPDGWVVLDFKTNHVGRRQPQKVAAEYTVQLNTYADAVRRMTAQPVKSKLIYFTQGSIEVSL